MPMYEYRCDACHKVMTVFVRHVGQPASGPCRFCHGDRLTRLISRVSTPKSESRRLEAFADPTALSGLDENDPKSVARWMKKTAGELGEDMDEAMLAEMDAAAEGDLSGEGSPDTLD